MSRTKDAKPKSESVQASEKMSAASRVRAYWRAFRASVRSHPRWAIVIAAVLLVGVSWGGYWVSRELSARNHMRQARAAINDGNHAAALANLDECLRVWPNDPEILLLQARTHWMAGNRAEASKQLAACKEAGGNAQRLALESQMIAASAGGLEQVESALQKHVEAGHPDKRYILEALIRGYLGRQRAEDAERLATVWIDESPDRWQPWLFRGIARTLMSKDLLSTAHDAAKRDFHRVLELKPDNEMARFLLGNAYVMSGQFREALPHLDRYCRLKPEDGQGITALAACHRALGQIEDARRTIDDWLKTHSATAEVLLLRGEIALDLAKPDEALDFFRRAQALAPSLEKTDFQIATALRALGRNDEASTHEEKWRSRNKLKERLQELEQTAAKEAQNVAVHHEAGTVALQLGNEPAAMRWLAAALKLEPNHRPTHEVLANHFESKGNVEAASFHRRYAQKLPR